jgi:diguanylate cyclase (GGDEF)-like protein
MIEPPIPIDETCRLQSLHSLRILDTEPEERFDRITRLAKRVFGVPIALVSLVDGHRQWFKSRQGLDASETPREISFCGHAVAKGELLVVENAALDGRFRENPLVTGEPRIRFYAGCPLLAPNGSALGTLCIIDTSPREFSEEDRRFLCELGSMLEDELFSLTRATTDDLTGLSNRRGFRTIATHVLSVCRRLASPAAVVLMDLDGFKQINDTRGHAEGDRVLKDFAATLLKTFRDSDVVARLGGDEFCVLLTGTEQTDISHALKRFQEGLDARHAPGQPLILFSAGVAHYDPGKHADVDALLVAVDERMYERKRERKLGSQATSLAG